MMLDLAFFVPPRAKCNAFKSQDRKWMASPWKELTNELHSAANVKHHLVAIIPLQQRNKCTDCSEYAKMTVARKNRFFYLNVDGEIETLAGLLRSLIPSISNFEGRMD